MTRADAVLSFKRFFIQYPELVIHFNNKPWMDFVFDPKDIPDYREMLNYLGFKTMYKSKYIIKKTDLKKFSVDKLI